MGYRVQVSGDDDDCGDGDAVVMMWRREGEAGGESEGEIDCEDEGVGEGACEDKRAIERESEGTMRERVGVAGESG